MVLLTSLLNLKGVDTAAIEFQSEIGIFGQVSCEDLCQLSLRGSVTQRSEIASNVLNDNLGTGLGGSADFFKIGRYKVVNRVRATRYLVSVNLSAFLNRPGFRGGRLALVRP